MTQRLTESLHPDAIGLDGRSDGQILGALLGGQQDAISAVTLALEAIGQASALMVRCLRAGGRLIYAGAGSSGLMALADAAELGGTFGVPARQIKICMAGGIPVEAAMPGDTEDDAAAGKVAADDLCADDLVIAVTASGSTPFPLALAAAARARGCRVVSIANNRDAEIFHQSDVAILLATPPELIAGSTRLGAATAQKAALNLMSSLTGIRLGQVHDGMMVGLIADNDKLRARAVDTVSAIADTDRETAGQALARSSGDTKMAVLLAMGAGLADAAALLAETDGNLRAAIARLRPSAERHEVKKTNQGSKR